MPLRPGEGLPAQFVEAVAAPWRSEAELKGVKEKAVQLKHYDMASAAHKLLKHKKHELDQNAIRTLRQNQAWQALHQEEAVLDTILTVDYTWAAQLDLLNREARAALVELQERHEDQLAQKRLEQVQDAWARGVRPERRSKELLNLRRCEAVLVENEDYDKAFKVHARAARLAYEEACDAHMGWLLKCHGQQSKLLAQQRRELDALRRRLEMRLREAELARERDMQQLERKIKVSNTKQAGVRKVERRTAEQMLSGRGIINTTTTRTGHGVRDSLPTMALANEASAAAAAQAGAVFHDPKSTSDQAPWHRSPSDYTPSYNPSSSLYLGPSSISGLKGLGGKSAAGSGSGSGLGSGSGSGGGKAGAAQSGAGGRAGAGGMGKVASPGAGVRFAPTPPSPGAPPPPRQAWDAASPPPQASPAPASPAPTHLPADMHVPSRSSSAHSGQAQAGAARTVPVSGMGGAVAGDGGAGAWADHADTAGAVPPPAAVTFSAWNQGEGATIMGSARRGQHPFNQPALSAAAASGATGSGGSGLTERNLREINRAARAAAQLRADARAAEATAYGSSSRNSARHSSSFRSDQPYAAGMSARMANDPLGPAAAGCY
ncbi:hypothetical protein HYH02_001958 [Chlamydomonas schloesseri]|uniref:Uncharacterized protein n=1 Tax=Chlamydomonas schloesseri TaxID=2026947 RepID=A0A835WTL5_9CHLO|nr:hypothetical protein HYH02_001958 [Chlamydomonas schloesseri]|eukprot:KAG2453747.1 hypothetical protein HYH02_001958 [Chlamydomonas schloesseri]